MTEIIECYAKIGKKNCGCDITGKAFTVLKIVKDACKSTPSRRKNPSLSEQLTRAAIKDRLVKETRYHVLCPVCSKINFVFETKKQFITKFKRYSIAYQMEVSNA